MLSIKCDRCGKSTKVHDTFYTSEAALAATIYTRDGDSDNMARTYDLCADCTRDLKRWIETPNVIQSCRFPFN